MERKSSTLLLVWPLLLAAAFFAPIAHAEDGDALVPLPSVLDFTRGSGWGLALGLGVEYSNSYDGADEYEFEFEPAGAVHYRTGNHLLFWEGNELGWRSRVMNDWLIQINARYEMGRESDDSDEGFLDGLDERDDEIVGVLEIRRSLLADWQAWIGGRIMSGDADFGSLFVIAGGYRLGSASDGTGTEFIAFATFGTSDFINRDFGITNDESAVSGYEAVDLDGGYRSVGLSILDKRYLWHKLMLVSEVGVEVYSGDIQDSPISREDYELEVGVSLLYHF